MFHTNPLNVHFFHTANNSNVQLWLKIFFYTTQLHLNCMWVFHWDRHPDVMKIYRISRPVRCTVIFSLEILEKKKNECILILVIYWKKTGLLHTKISKYNIIYSSQKPRKLSSLPLKPSSWLFLLDAGTGIYKFGNNTYPRRIRRRSNLGHIWGGECVLWTMKYGTE